MNFVVFIVQCVNHVNAYDQNTAVYWIFFDYVIFLVQVSSYVRLICVYSNKSQLSKMQWHTFNDISDRSVRLPVPRVCHRNVIGLCLLFFYRPKGKRMSSLKNISRLIYILTYDVYECMMDILSRILTHVRVIFSVIQIRTLGSFHVTIILKYCRPSK